MNFNLGPTQTQNILVVPSDAYQFETVLESDGAADLVWYDFDSVTSSNPDGIAIVGTSNAVLTADGTYRGMVIEYSGKDNVSPIQETISSELVSVRTAVRVTAGPLGAAGTVRLSWNGEMPCGEVCRCEMPPTPQPTTSPTSRPTSTPSDAPTPCPEGTTRVYRDNVCYGVSDETPFTLAAGESTGIVALPIGAINFESTLSMFAGDADLPLIHSSFEGVSVCYYGNVDDCV